MSILKRGIATMPLPTHRTFTQYSLPSNWHRPFEPLPNPSRDGPWVPMGCSDIPDTYMSRILAYAFGFFNTHTIIPLQDIMVSPRPSTRSASTTIGPDFRPMSKTTANRAPSVLAPNPCATDHTGFSSSFPFPRGRGIPSPWISLRNYPSLPVIRLY